MTLKYCWYYENKDPEQTNFTQMQLYLLFFTLRTTNQTSVQDNFTIVTQSIYFS